MTHLCAKNLSVSLGGDFSLCEVNFEVHSGDLVGIVGPNGSGKTTLLRSLSGILDTPPESLTLNGNQLKNLSPTVRARSLAVVSQEEHLQFPFTAAQVCLLGRSPYLSGMGFESAADRQIVQESMEATGVYHLANRTYSTLSGGEKKRVAIARALAQQPEVLLLDEPLASLDLKHQVQVFKLLQQCADGGMAVAVVLHDLNKALKWCNRTYVMRDGRVIANGNSSEVLVPETIQKAFGIAVINVAKDSETPFYTP